MRLMTNGKTCHACWCFCVVLDKKIEYIQKFVQRDISGNHPPERVSCPSYCSAGGHRSIAIAAGTSPGRTGPRPGPAGRRAGRRRAQAGSTASGRVVSIARSLVTLLGRSDGRADPAAAVAMTPPTMLLQAGTVLTATRHNPFLVPDNAAAGPLHYSTGFVQSSELLCVWLLVT